MNAMQEVREQYKQAVKQTIRYPRVAYHKGRVSGLRTALFYLGVNDDEILEIHNTCEEEVKDERAQEDVGPGDVSYDEEGFLIEDNITECNERRAEREDVSEEDGELDAIERPVSPKEWTAYCDECGKPFNSKDAVKVPYQEYPGAAFSDEQVSPCCGAGYSDRPKEEDDIYECEHCNAEFKASEILYHKYGGEIGTIAFCPRCYQATKLICVTDLVEARK